MVLKSSPISKWQKNSNYFKGELGKLMGKRSVKDASRYLLVWRLTSVILLWSLLRLSLCGGTRGLPSMSHSSGHPFLHIRLYWRLVGKQPRSPPSLVPPLPFEENLEVSVGLKPSLWMCHWCMAWESWGTRAEAYVMEELSPVASTQHVSHLQFLYLPSIIIQRKGNN